MFTDVDFYLSGDDLVFNEVQLRRYLFDAQLVFMSGRQFVLLSDVFLFERSEEKWLQVFLWSTKTKMFYFQTTPEDLKDTDFQSKTTFLEQYRLWISVLYDTLHLRSVQVPAERWRDDGGEGARAEDEDHRLAPEASQQEEHLNQLVLVIIEQPQSR